MSDQSTATGVPTTTTCRSGSSYATHPASTIEIRISCEEQIAISAGKSSTPDDDDDDDDEETDIDVEEHSYEQEQPVEESLPLVTDKISIPKFDLTKKSIWSKLELEVFEQIRASHSGTKDHTTAHKCRAAFAAAGQMLEL